MGRLVFFVQLFSFFSALSYLRWYAECSLLIASCFVVLRSVRQQRRCFVQYRCVYQLRVHTFHDKFIFVMRATISSEVT